GRGGIRPAARGGWGGGAHEAEGGVGPATVGVGIPGAISLATGLIKNANSTWINGRPLAADLASALGREVRLANDANCFALSEAVDRAAAGASVGFGGGIGAGTRGRAARNRSLP